MDFPKATIEDVEGAILEETYTVLPNGRTTVCQLTINPHFTVEGSSACVSKENFDAKTGNKFARERALDQVWMLKGYDLSKFLTMVKAAGPVTGKILLLEDGDKIRPVGTYVGTKVVHAVPMNREDYNRLRGWTVPADENPGDLGYLVQYADGGAPNVEGFDGYISWSPKDVFERSYHQGISGVQASHLHKEEVKPKWGETFLDRLKFEEMELSERIGKLQAFLGSGGEKKLPRDEQIDLYAQIELMENYQSILHRRIQRATTTGKVTP